MSFDTQKLSQIFGQYNGQTLLNPNRITCDADMVLEEIREKATQNGLTSVRVLYPGQRFTMEINKNRLKVHVNNDDGVLKVAAFSIG